MPDQDLIKYLIQELNAGYRANQLRSYLISQGYNANEVDQALNSAKQSMVVPPPAADVKSLQDMIKSYLSQGRDINVVRNQLIGQGYPVSMVDEAIGVVQKPEAKIRLLPIAVAVLFVLFISFGGFMFYKLKILEKPEIKPWMQLDVEIEMLSKHPEPGKKLIYNVKASNLGTLQGYDVVFSHVVTDVKTRKVIIFEQESRAIQTTLGFIKDFDIPTYVKPGNYILDVKAEYINTSAKATQAFRIYEVEEKRTFPECNINSDCEDDELCDQGLCVLRKEMECREDRDCNESEICEGGRCTAVEAAPECYFDSDCEENQECRAGECISLIPEGAECLRNDDCMEDEVCQNLECVSFSELLNISVVGMTHLEKKQLIMDAASKDPDKAKKLCAKFSGEVFGSLCFIYISEVSNDPEYCEDIEDADSKERCYARFLYEQNDFTVCDRLVKEQNQNFCEMAKRLSLLRNLGNLTGTTLPEVPSQPGQGNQDSYEKYLNQ